jgi:hypothetical protein
MMMVMMMMIIIIIIIIIIYLTANGLSPSGSGYYKAVPLQAWGGPEGSRKLR